LVSLVSMMATLALQSLKRVFLRPNRLLPCRADSESGHTFVSRQAAQAPSQEMQHAHISPGSWPRRAGQALTLQQERLQLVPAAA
jgi:hypothetical protein